MQIYSYRSYIFNPIRNSRYGFNTYKFIRASVNWSQNIFFVFYDPGNLGVDSYFMSIQLIFTKLLKKRWFWVMAAEIWRLKKMLNGAKIAPASFTFSTPYWCNMCKKTSYFSDCKVPMICHPTILLMEKCTYRIPGEYCLHDLSRLFSTDHMSLLHVDLLWRKIVSWKMIPPSMNAAMMLGRMCFHNTLFGF